MEKNWLQDKEIKLQQLQQQQLQQQQIDHLCNLPIGQMTRSQLQQELPSHTQFPSVPPRSQPSLPQSHPLQVQPQPHPQPQHMPHHSPSSTPLTHPPPQVQRGSSAPYIIITNDKDRHEDGQVDFAQLDPAPNESQLDALFISGGITNVINLVPKLKRRLGMVQDSAVQTDEPQVEVEPAIATRKDKIKPTDTKQIDDLLKRLFAQTVMKASDEKPSVKDVKKLNNTTNTVIKPVTPERKNPTKNDKKQSPTKTVSVVSSNENVTSQDVEHLQNAINVQRALADDRQSVASSGPKERRTNTRNSERRKRSQQSQKSSAQSSEKEDTGSGEAISAKGVSPSGLTSVNNIMAMLYGEKSNENDKNEDNVVVTC